MHRRTSGRGTCARSSPTAAISPANGIGVLEEPKRLGRILPTARIPARPPRNHGELVGESIELPPPDATVAQGPMHQHQRRPLASLFEGDANPGDLSARHFARDSTVKGLAGPSHLPLLGRKP